MQADFDNRTVDAFQQIQCSRVRGGDDFNRIADRMDFISGIDSFGE